MKKIITIVGARPQIIKSSAISRAIKNHFSESLTEIIVHTGQHYDENMSHVFFEEMEIPNAKYNLEVGSASHGVMTAKMLEGLEHIFLKENADAVLVYGDTNSTIAGALAASKLHIPVIHVEAGLRSFNKKMPEEINRICCDHMSSMLFTPTQSGIDNLRNEGFNIDNNDKINIDHAAIYQCGDVMYDNSLYFSKISEQKSNVIKDLNLSEDQFVLATIHRDSNTDVVENLNSIFKSLLAIQEQSKLKIVLPLHPRTKARLKDLLSTDLYKNVFENQFFLIIEPVGFMDIIALEKNAKLIITDSGGLQKEAFFFKKPCLILREQTEWTEIVENGNAILCGADTNRILKAFNELSEKKDFSYPTFYGDGKAAEFICQTILKHL